MHLSYSLLVPYRIKKLVREIFGERLERRLVNFALVIIINYVKSFAQFYALDGFNIDVFLFNLSIVNIFSLSKFPLIWYISGINVT